MKVRALLSVLVLVGSSGCGESSMSMDAHRADGGTMDARLEDTMDAARHLLEDAGIDATQRNDGSDPCASHRSNAMSTIGCNGFAMGSAARDEPLGSCIVSATEERGTCSSSEPTTVCVPLDAGSDGVCAFTCSPGPSSISSGGCPVGWRCFSDGSSQGLCFRDCDASHPCPSGSVCDPDGSCLPTSADDGGVNPDGGVGTDGGSGISYARCTDHDPSEFYSGYRYSGPGHRYESVDLCRCAGDALSVATGGFGAGDILDIDLVPCTSCVMEDRGAELHCYGPRAIAPASVVDAPRCNGAGYFDGMANGRSFDVQTVVAGYRSGEGISVYLFEDTDAITTWPGTASEGDRRIRLNLGALSGPTRLWAQLALYEFTSGAWTRTETASQVLADVQVVERSGAAADAACYGRVAGTVVAVFSEGSLIGAFDAPLLGPAF